MGSDSLTDVPGHDTSCRFAGVEVADGADATCCAACSGSNELGPDFVAGGEGTTTGLWGTVKLTLAAGLGASQRARDSIINDGAMEALSCALAVTDCGLDRVVEATGAGADAVARAALGLAGC